MTYGSPTRRTVALSSSPVLVLPFPPAPAWAWGVLSATVAGRISVHRRLHPVPERSLLGTMYAGGTAAALALTTWLWCPITIASRRAITSGPVSSC